MNKIIRPKLEKGNKPSGWSPCSIWSSSLIKQTADAVTIQVEQEIQGLSGLTQRVGTLEVTASAITQDVQALSATTTGLTQQVGNLTVKSDSISASVTTLEEKVANTNLFPLNGWKDNFDKYIEVDSDQRYSGSTGSSAITSPTIYLEKGTYTISCWESSNKAFTGAQNAQGDTLIPSTNKTTATGLENAYKSIQRTWCNVSISQAGNYYFKIESNNFYKPKLEIGSTPTPYSNQTVDHHSLIQQTDSSISLKVVEEVQNEGLVNETQLKETGIDITSGEITLNADKTTINGNLRITNADQGIKVYDNGLEKISIANESLSNLDDYDFGQDLRVSQAYSTGATNTIVDWTFSLGNYTQTEKLRVHDITVKINLDNDVFGDRNQSASWTISLKQGDNVVTGTSGTISTEYNPMGYVLPDFIVNSLPTTGEYTLHVTLTPTFTTTQGSSYIEHSCYAYIEKIGQGIIRLGNDGAVFASSQKKYNWFGSDKTQLQQGEYGLRMSESGITRNGVHVGSTTFGEGLWGDISSTIPIAYVNSLTYTPTALDGLIVFSTVIGQADDAQRTLTLPAPSSLPAGKWYKVKNICGNNTVVTCTQENKIVYFDDHGWHTSSNIGDDMYSFINTGYEWLEGK